MARTRLSRSGRSTLISLAIALSLVVAAVVVVALLPPAGPSSAAEAERAVTTTIEEITSTIPSAAILDTHDDASTSACVTDAGKVTTRVERVVTIDPAVDRIAWSRQVRSRFSDAEEWTLRVRTLDARDNLRLTLVGRDLSRFTITAVGDDDGARIAISADSECAPA